MSDNTGGWGYQGPSDDETSTFPPVGGAGQGQAGQGQAGQGEPSPWQAAPAPEQQNPWAAPTAAPTGPAGPQYRYDAQYQQPYQEPYPPQQPQKSGGGGRILAAVIAVLVVIAVALVLVWQWDNLFGKDDDQGSGSGAGQTVTQQAGSDGADQSAGAGASDGAEAPGPDDKGRPTTAAVPAGSVPANDAARNGEPTGQFNAVWVSPPNGTTYTSESFGVAVRDAYAEAYLADPSRAVDRTVNATSPETGNSYTMSCRDQGSYVHCTGGNDANVYIA
jgi:hypothetical protein